MFHQKQKVQFYSS